MMEAERAATSRFGALLRQHRLAAGLTQEALAERAGLSAVGIGVLERGARQLPQRATVELLAKALHLTTASAAELEAAAARPERPRSRAASDAPTAGEPRRTNLPLQVKTLVGRSSEVHELAGLVEQTRSVTITGAGGIGKTSAALEVGSSMLERMGDGVWIVEFAPIVDASLVAATIARALGIQESVSGLETLLAHLKNKKMLLILDNCEHLIAEVTIVADALLRRCAGMRILATSREPLRIAGERAYRLPSLDTPSREGARRLAAADAATYPAIALFVERAQAADSRFGLSDENAPIVGEICRRLDGIPLAIELAAARVTILAVGALCEKLDQRLRLLTSGERTALPRHRTMRALMDWSYDLLSPSEQRFFETVSIFAGGWTLAAATAVFAAPAADVDAVEVLGLLGSLVDKSLVVADLERREVRYRLLESAREYAREKLAARGEATRAARGHALVYLELAERLHRAYELEADHAWFLQAADAAAEFENWQAALGWALGERHDVLLGQRLIAALYPLWSGRFAGPAAMRQWVRTALDAVDAATPVDVVARLECAEAVLASFFHEDSTALASAESALARFREVGDSIGVARAQTVAALSFAYLGRPEHALTLADEGLKTVRRRGHRPLAGWLLIVSGLARSMVGDFAAARGCIAEAIVVYTEAGDDGRATMTRSYHLPNVEFRAGDAEAAARYAADALAHYRARNDLHAVTILCSWLAAYLIALGRYEEAEERAGEALSLARELGWRVMVAGALQRFAALAFLRPPRDGKRGQEFRADGARLLGFVDARLADLKATRRLTDRVEYDRLFGAMTEAFGADALAVLMSAGAEMTEDRAIEQAASIRASHT